MITCCKKVHVAYKVCSALDPDKGTELELTVYTLTVHDGGVNQGLCAESKMYIDDLRVKGGVILGRVGLGRRPGRGVARSWGRGL